MLDGRENATPTDQMLPGNVTERASILPPLEVVGITTIYDPFIVLLFSILISVLNLLQNLSVLEAVKYSVTPKQHDTPPVVGGNKNTSWAEMRELLVPWAHVYTR